MKFLKETILLEDSEFLKSIDARNSVNGKIRVSKQEWHRLWDLKLGYPDKDVHGSISDTKEWLKQTKEFANKYECV